LLNEKDADELARELLDRRARGVEKSWNAIFDWWPGYPPDHNRVERRQSAR
jgi:hypothetical protein